MKSEIDHLLEMYHLRSSELAGIQALLKYKQNDIRLCIQNKNKEEYLKYRKQASVLQARKEHTQTLCMSLQKKLSQYLTTYQESKILQL